MLGRTALLVSLGFALATPAQAQAQAQPAQAQPAQAQPAQAQSADGRVEITVNGSYTSSGGISGNAVVAGDGNVYNRIDADNGASFHVTAGYIGRSGGEIGFLWGRQTSQLRLTGLNTLTLGDMNIDSYHVYFGYNVGEFDAGVRPYVMAGLGATAFSSVDYVTAVRSGSIPGTTKFSTTFGAGLKFYAGENIGFKAGVRWTPTYVSSDELGWWCDPFIGCYTVSDPNYVNQIEVSGGVALRF